MKREQKVIMSTPSAKSTPSGFRSLKSRITKHENMFSPSGLSSKTKALLHQLERVYTPSKEVRRMAIMKSATTERWANERSPVTPGAPPLKGMKHGPTRLQMLANKYCFIKSRLPYWKDIHRPTMKERDEAAKNKNDSPARVPDLDGTKLCAMFEVPSPKKKPEPAELSRSSILKGTDGVSRNVFNTADLDSLEDLNTLPLPTAVPMPVVPLPQKGFLGDLAFSFELPKYRTETDKKPVRHEISSSETTDSDESSSDEEEDMTTESVDATPIRADNNVVAKSIDAASSPINVSLKDASVQMDKFFADKNTSIEKPAEEVVKHDEAVKKEETPQEAPWSCPTCFVNNTGSLCACCGTAKDGSSAAAPTLVSIFPPGQSSTSGSFNFGFGSSSTDLPQQNIVKPMFGFPTAIPSCEPTPITIQPSFGFPSVAPVAPIVPTATVAPTGFNFGPSTATPSGSASGNAAPTLVSISPPVQTSTSGSFNFGFGSSSTDLPQQNIVKPMFGFPTAIPSCEPTPITIQPSFGFPSVAPVAPIVPTATVAPTGFNFGPSTAPSGSASGNPAPSMFLNDSASSSFGSAFINTTSEISSAPSGFNFGALAAPATIQPFVFGSNPAPSLPVFGQSSAPSADFGNAFAYKPNPSGPSAATRKIALARRRVARK